MANRYNNIPTEFVKGKGQVYSSVLLPDVKASDDDIIINTTEGDRLDLLAYQFYNDVNFWWVIALKNNLNNGDLTLDGGIILRIPSLSEANEILNSIK